MKRKIIGILVCITLILTSVTISAFNEEPELLGINTMTHDILFDEMVGIISFTDPCIMPDNGFGTIDLPAMCPYIAPDDPMYIIDGLSPGTTMELDPTLDNFYNILNYPGGLLGGEVLTFDATLQLAVSGTGSLAGFNRNLATSVSLEIHTGPRTPGDPIQMFPSDIFQLYGEIFGDPDFCMFRVSAGSDYGLPSPGQFTLTELISGDFNVDSFFDITYQIEFEGCPGSILEGLSGMTTATTRLQQGTEVTNTPPNKPSMPDGPSSGIIDVEYMYYGVAADPDMDWLAYRFDFGNTITGWTSYTGSGIGNTETNIWSVPGTYQVKVQAKDIPGAISSWSDPLTVVISSGENQPPNKPSTPSGPTSGKAGTSYTYSTLTTDPEGDQMYYKWDWGDEVSDWDGPYNSGDLVTQSHIWSNQGTYAVKVKAKDTSDVESVWSDPLPISMPKNKQHIPLGIILAFGFDVDVKVVQLEPGEDYVDLEVLSKPFYIWENEIQTINSGAFIRLYFAKGFFSPSVPICFGICEDWSLIG
jgi:PKD domain-containing protein